MKTSIQLICAAALAAIVMTGCQTGSDAGGGANAGNAPKNGKKMKVGVSIPAADHGWTAGVKYWADQATKANPDIEWVIKDAKGPTEQINDLQNMQTQGVDAVVILCTESAPITETTSVVRLRPVVISTPSRIEESQPPTIEPMMPRIRSPQKP